MCPTPELFLKFEEFPTRRMWCGCCFTA